MGNDFLWEDKILGNSPLSSKNSFSELKIWMTNKGLLCLADICLGMMRGIGMIGNSRKCLID